MSRVNGGCQASLTGVAILGQVDGDLPANAPGSANDEGYLAGGVRGRHGGRWMG